MIQNNQNSCFLPWVQAERPPSLSPAPVAMGRVKHVPGQQHQRSPPRPSFSSASQRQVVAEEFAKGDEGTLFFLQSGRGISLGGFRLQEFCLPLNAPRARPAAPSPPSLASRPGGSSA